MKNKFVKKKKKFQLHSATQEVYDFKSLIFFNSFKLKCELRFSHKWLLNKMQSYCNKNITYQTRKITCF